MAADEGFDFPDDDSPDASQLYALGSKLIKAPGRKDALIKLLKQVSAALEKLPQDVDALGLARRTIPAGLANKAVLHHTDKEVRLYVARSLAQLLRVYAPDTPYTDDELRDIFRTILHTFDKLDAGSGSFNMQCMVLQLFAEVRLYLLLPDLETPELITQIFRTLLSGINDNNSANLELPVGQILSGLLAELDVVGQDILEPILRALLNKDGESDAARRLARLLVQRCEEQLRAPLQEFVAAVLQGRATTDLKPHIFGILFQLHQASEQLLMPVVPLILAELVSEDETRRIAACKLMSRLLGAPGAQSVAQAYPQLVHEFLERYTDVSSTIRIQMLDASPALLLAGPSAALHAKVMDGVSGRLFDLDEKVRCHAVRAMCAYGTADLAHMPPAVLHSVAERLRDTRVSVRKETATALFGVWHAFCSRVMQIGGLSDSVDEQGLWIAGNLLARAAADSELRPHVLHLAHGHGLLPFSMTNELAARVWAALYATCGSDTERDFVIRLLGQKASTRAELRTVLDIRSRMRAADITPEQKEQLGRKLAQALETVAAGCSTDLALARAQLAKLMEMRDNYIFERLASLCDVTVSVESQTACRKDLLQRIESKSPLATLVTAVLNTVQPTLLPLATAQGLLFMLRLPLAPKELDTIPTSQADTPEGDATATQAATAAKGPAESQLDALVLSAGRLVVATSKVAPTLFLPLVPDVVELLTGVPPNDLAASVAARTLAHCALAYMAQMPRPDLPPRTLSALGQVCQNGAPRGAKYAVLALARLQPSSKDVMGKMSRLASAIMTQLPKSPGSLVALQALSSVARAAPDALAPHAQDLCRSVVEDFLEAENQGLELATGNCGIGAGRLDPLERAPYSAFVAAAVAAAVGAAALPESPGEVALCKGQAMKALARTLAPEAPSKAVVAAPLAETMRQAAVSLMAALEPTLDPENNLAGFLGAMPSQDEDEAALWQRDQDYLRIMGASAALRLMRRFDKDMAPATYCAVALTMQAVPVEVRAGFGVKVHRQVKLMAVRSSVGQLQLAAKTAAMLALAGMDPVRHNTEAAGRALREYVQSRRSCAKAEALRAAQQQPLAAANEGAGPSTRVEGRAREARGSELTRHPEFLVPYLVYLLAHHPDFPDCNTAASQQPASMDTDAAAAHSAAEREEAESLRSFQKMLQMGLEPLLRGRLGTEAGAALPAILKIVKTIKQTEDADTENSANEQLLALCDMAAAVARGIVQRDSKPARGGAEPTPLPTASDYPGGIVLPTSLYRARTGPKVRPTEGEHLPRNFKLSLDTDIAQLGQAALAGGGRQRAAKPRAARTPRRQRLASDMGQTGSGRKRTAASPLLSGQGSQDAMPASEGSESEESSVEVLPAKRRRGSTADKADAPTSNLKATPSATPSSKKAVAAAAAGVTTPSPAHLPAAAAAKAISAEAVELAVGQVKPTPLLAACEVGGRPAGKKRRAADTRRSTDEDDAAAASESTPLAAGRKQAKPAPQAARSQQALAPGRATATATQAADVKAAKQAGVAEAKPAKKALASNSKVARQAAAAKGVASRAKLAKLAKTVGAAHTTAQHVNGVKEGEGRDDAATDSGSATPSPSPGAPAPAPAQAQPSTRGRTTSARQAVAAAAAVDGQATVTVKGKTAHGRKGSRTRRDEDGGAQAVAAAAHSKDGKPAQQAKRATGKKSKAATGATNRARQA